MKSVLVIEDDILIAELERDYLQAHGFSVEIELNGEKGLKRALAEEFSAILVDVMLPGKDGFEICRMIRQQKNIPLIMVTARKEDLDKIRGLGLGVDDYVVKPFSPLELVARVRAHIEIHKRLLDEKQKINANTITISQLKILPLEHRVYVGDTEVILANKEFELLLFLAENPNIVFSKDTLFDRIWGMNSSGTTATVTVHINRLREKLEHDPADPKLIETVWGAGYRMASL